MTQMQTEDYDGILDGFRSYYGAIAAMRERHLTIVKKLRPALFWARHDLGISQQALATAMGVSDTLLCEWESGAEIPAPDMFDRWRNLLGV